MGYEPTFPKIGNITDMEDMNLKVDNFSLLLSENSSDNPNANIQSKLDFLKSHKLWKCMNKTEVLAEHPSTWMQNGLSCLSYRTLKSENLSDHCIKFHVDVLLNDHWSDLVCSDDNTQLDTTVDELKKIFREKKSCEK
jgi:hypothetical protein